MRYFAILSLYIISFSLFSIQKQSKCDLDLIIEKDETDIILTIKNKDSDECIVNKSLYIGKADFINNSIYFEILNDSGNTIPIVWEGVGGYGGLGEYMILKPKESHQVRTSIQFLKWYYKLISGNKYKIRAHFKDNRKPPYELIEVTTINKNSIEIRKRKYFQGELVSNWIDFIVN